MAQASHGHRLALKAAGRILLRGHVALQNFDSNVTVKAGLVGFEDLGKAAAA
jgi:hypothetical protein